LRDQSADFRICRALFGRKHRYRLAAVLKRSRQQVGPID
jgi:hypothetical protein